MRIQNLIVAAAVAGLAMSPAAAQQQQPTKAEIDAAVRTLSLITSAIDSKDVPIPIKNALFGCLYGKPLNEISAALTKTLKANPQIDAKDNTKSLVVLSRLCGAPPPKPKAN